MNTVGLRQLKNRLSELVRRVRAGEIILVTDRGEIVAEIRPRAANGQTDHHEVSLAKLRRTATLGLPNDRRVYPRMPRIMREGRAQQLLDEERGGR